MPRATDQSYLSNYDALRNEYLQGGRSFALLEPQEQWALFWFSQHHERHRGKEFLMYRHEISLLNPSLPQKAGKAFRPCQQLQAVTMAQRRQATEVRRNSTDFSMGFQANPEPDPKRLARIFIEIGAHLHEQEKGQEAPKSEPPAPAHDSPSSGR